MSFCVATNVHITHSNFVENLDYLLEFLITFFARVPLYVCCDDFLKLGCHWSLMSYVWSLCRRSYSHVIVVLGLALQTILFYYTGSCQKAFSSLPLSYWSVLQFKRKGTISVLLTSRTKNPVGGSPRPLIRRCLASLASMS